MNLKKHLSQVISILITITCAILLLRIPSGGENTFLFGFSLQRMVFLLDFFILCVAQSLVFFLLKEENTPIWWKKWIQFLLQNQVGLFGILAILLISWYFTFLPIERFPGNQAIFTRIKPGIIWIFLQSTLLIATIFLNEERETNKVQIEKQGLVQGGLFVVFAASIWMLIARTQIGLTQDVFWDNLGVPLTITQVMLALVITALIYGIYQFISKNKNWTKRENIILFFLIWTIAALVWIHEPQHTSTFNPGPFYPNNEFYPNSDAQVYDTCALSAQLGQNYCYFNNNNVSKPLYTMFLFLLHLISGTSNSTLINFQVVFLAILPALIYLIGKHLHSNAVGILAALFAIIKINNSIADSLVIWTVSNPKFMMSEPFLAVFLALFCLFFILWYQDPQHSKTYLYVSAAVLGLSTLIRHNVWILVPVFMLVVLIRAKGNGWKKISRSIIFLLLILLVMTPWVIRNLSLNLNSLSSIDSLKYVVLERRYGIQENYDSVENTDSTNAPVEEANTNHASGENMTVDESSPVTSPPSTSIFDNPTFTKIGALLSSTENHFLHNLIGVFFTLPISSQTGSIHDTILNTWEVNPWTRTWDGTLNLDAKTFMGINILIIGMGIINLYRKSKTSYFIPLLIMISYLVGVGFAKTSGGRYIVPVDWILLLFYAAGLLFLFDFFGKRQKMELGSERIVSSDREEKISSNKSATILLAVFLGIGIFLPISENLFPEINFPQNYSQFLEELEQKGYQAEQVPFSTTEVEQFLEEKNATFIAGQGFYPRILDPQDENTTEFYHQYLRTPYTLLFTSLNEGGKYYIYLPISNPKITFSQGANVYILGCYESKSIVRALSVIVMNENMEIINSNGLLTLSCGY